MAKKKLTQNDLDKTLRDLGFKEGDELELSSEQNLSNEGNEENEGDGNQTTNPVGGSNPGDKPKPEKP